MTPQIGSGRQQINLYQLPEKPRGLQINTKTISLGLALFLGLLVAMTWSQSTRRDQLADQLSVLKTQQTRFASQLESMRASLPKDQGAQLEQERLRQEQKLQQLQQLRSLMEKQEKQESVGFAAQMSSLAQQHLDGISLSEIRFLKGGNYIELRGDAHPAETVPQYLQQLKADRPFQQAKFGPLHLERDEERSGIMHFWLGSEEGTMP